jgi:hypothetical protein
MVFSRLALAAVVVLSAAAMPGCSLFGGGGHDSGLPLIAAPNPPIADVPVPAGFSLVKEKSTSKVTAPANLRIVDHLYSGNEDYLPVIRFYRDQLPPLGWQLVDQTQNGPETTLHFTKGNEDCRVTVSAPTLTLNAHIRIKIDPIAQNAK